MIICGQCQGQFDSDEAFITHYCPEMGCTPTDPQYMGPDYAAIQEAAVTRGQERQALIDQGQPDPAIAAIVDQNPELADVSLDPNQIVFE